MDDSREQREETLSDLKTVLLKHISSNSEAHFKSQQVGDPDLTMSEKFDIAESLLNKSSSLFLAKYGKYLLEDHLKYFEGSDDYEVNFYLTELFKGKVKPISKPQIRNRRLEALRRMCQKGEYFSDLEMKRRNPLLYEELVGQYLTDQEKIEFEKEQATDKTFASIFLDIVERNFMDTKLKMEIQNDYNSMDTSGKGDLQICSTSTLWEEMSENSQDELQLWQKRTLWGEMGENSRSNTKRVLENSRYEEISSKEKALLVNEFRSRVYSDFLGGKDTEFDYSQIDSNAEYDDLSMLESDQQDSYFDAESPKTVFDEDSNESMCD